ncbi:MAG: HupE/UreJ family protein [Chitinophagaceae bacterium]|nr:HupE/UreJ family protein [Chitinophagaceae bacterium]
MQFKAKYFLLSIVIFFTATNNLLAHATVMDIEQMSTTDTLLLFLQLGFQHIIPLGLDHILFIIALFIINPKFKDILIQATAFTIAHTITLGLSMFQIIKAPTAIVEVIIAISILYVAIENIFSSKVKPSRIAVVFVFGLIHGLGFAAVLSDIGLPQNKFISSLLMFNVGVEFGQIAVIAALYFTLIKWVRNAWFYKSRIVIPLSIIIGLVSIYWIFERI